MKKYLSAIAALCLCRAAWAADIYITGHENNWTLDDEFKFQQSGEIYSIHLDLISAEKFPYGFKIAESGWSKQYGTKEDFPLDKTAKCVAGDGNNFYVPDDIKSITGATIVFDKTDAVNPTLTVRPDLYLAGSINSWANTNADYRFAYTNGTYSLALDNLDGEFRIAAGVNDQNDDWLINYGGAQNMSAGNTYDCIEGSGNDMTVAGGLIRNAMLTFDYNARKLTIGSISTEGAKDGLYLAGTINNWASDNASYRFTENGGIYTLTVPRLSGEFKIVTKDWSLQFGCDSKIEYGHEYSCFHTSNGSNISLVDNVGIDVVLTFDLENMILTADGVPTLYLVGDFNNWTVSPLYAFGYDNGVYTLKTSDFNGAFKVVTADNSLQFGTHFGFNLDLGREYALMDSGADMTFGGLTSRAASRVKITVRANGTPFNGSVSGIEDVDASGSGAAVEYYNLQGVRVYNPGNGFYIKRTGSVIEKIYVK